MNEQKAMKAYKALRSMESAAALKKAGFTLSDYRMAQDCLQEYARNNGEDGTATISENEEQIIALTLDDFVGREIKDETKNWTDEAGNLTVNGFDEYETTDGCSLKELPCPIISEVLEAVYGDAFKDKHEDKQMRNKRKALNGTAEFRKLGNDLYWNFYTIDESNHFEFVKVKWIGYNDAFWWNNVATTEQAQIATGSNGRKYKINFLTNEVIELNENS